MAEQITLHELVDDTFPVWSQMRRDLWDDCDDARNADDFQTYLKRKDSGEALVLLARDDGTPVGFIESELRRDFVMGATRRPIWYVEGIYVKPDYRRKNVGRELVAGLARWVKADELASDCELGHDDSQLFHEAVGFKEAGRSIHFWMDLSGTS